MVGSGTIVRNSEPPAYSLFRGVFARMMERAFAFAIGVGIEGPGAQVLRAVY